MPTTKALKATVVNTWLPIFSGFYETIWDTDSDEESELWHINEAREEKGLSEVSYEDVEWGYEEYHRAVAKGITTAVADRLIEAGFISGFRFQKLNSPREYNFANDSINVLFTLDDKNRQAISAYLAKNNKAFSEYLERYRSRSGFISFYSASVEDWMGDLSGVLAHEHQLGAVLDFILRNEDADMEMDVREDLHGNGVCLMAENYEALTEVK